MQAAEIASSRLEALCRQYDLILVRDYHRLAELPDTFPEGEGSHRVVRGRGNLSFRLEYEPLRYEGRRLIIHLLDRDCFIPDIEARIRDAGEELTLSLRWLLAQATGLGDIPHEVEALAPYARTHFQALADFYALFCREEDRPPREAELRRIALSALLGTRLFGAAGPATFWWLWFSRAGEIEALAEDLRRELLAILEVAPAPLPELPYGDARSVAERLWVRAILSQHLEEPGPLGERFGLVSASAGLETLAAQICQSYPALAREQITLAERRLVEITEALVDALGLREPQKAIGVAFRERYSPFMLRLALRELLLAASSQPELLAGERLAQLRKRLRALPEEAPGELLSLMEVAEALGLAMEMEKNLAAGLGRLKDAASLGPFLSLYVDERGYLLASLMARLRQLLSALRGHAQEWGWDEGALACIAENMETRLARLEGIWAELTVRFAQAAGAHWGPWLRDEAVASARRLLARIASRREKIRYPKAHLLVCEGLGWSNWERHLRPILSSHYHIEVEPMLWPGSEAEPLAEFGVGREPDGIYRAAWPGGEESFELREERSAEEEGLRLWLISRGLEILHFTSAGALREELGRMLELGPRKIVYLAGAGRPGRDHSLEERILPLVTLRPRRGRWRGGLFVGPLRLRQEYQEDMESSLVLEVWPSGETLFRSVEVEVELAGLAEVKPFQALIPAEGREIVVPFTPRAENLRDEERGLEVIARPVRVSLSWEEGGRRMEVARPGILRLRLKKEQFSRMKSETLDRILGLGRLKKR